MCYDREASADAHTVVHHGVSPPTRVSFAFHITERDSLWADLLSICSTQLQYSISVIRGPGLITKLSARDKEVAQSARRSCSRQMSPYLIYMSMPDPSNVT